MLIMYLIRGVPWKDRRLFTELIFQREQSRSTDVELHIMVKLYQLFSKLQGDSRVCAQEIQPQKRTSFFGLLLRAFLPLSGAERRLLFWSYLLTPVSIGRVYTEC